MGSKTVDETGAETGAEATTDEEAARATEVARTTGLTKTGEVGEVGEVEEVTETGYDAEAGADTADDAEAAADFEDEYLEGDSEPVEAEDSTDVVQGVGAIVSAALGVVSLTGGWVGTVASARESLVGQLETSSSASVAKQVKEVYGDAWQATALWGGLFALAALVVGVVILARPAFGAPGKPQPVWIKSVAWSGVTLGVIGLLLAVLKYTDILLGLPSTS